MVENDNLSFLMVSNCWYMGLCFPGSRDFRSIATATPTQRVLHWEWAQGWELRSNSHFSPQPQQMVDTMGIS
jgi:hypothetical protein